MGDWKISDQLIDEYQNVIDSREDKAGRDSFNSMRDFLESKLSEWDSKIHSWIYINAMLQAMFQFILKNNNEINNFKDNFISSDEDRKTLKRLVEYAYESTIELSNSNIENY